MSADPLRLVELEDGGVIVYFTSRAIISFPNAIFVRPPPPPGNHPYGSAPPVDSVLASSMCRVLSGSTVSLPVVFSDRILHC